MRNLQEELKKLVDFAKKDDNIRAMVLQGSVADDYAEKDQFTDLDPLFYVRDITKFTKNENWKNNFGTPMSFFNDEGEFFDGDTWITRLVLYSDGFKIDFGFQPIEQARYANDMNLYKVLIDKDNVVPKPLVTTDSKFNIPRPSEQEFLKVVNEFFFDTSYIVKSIIREEMFFEKYMESMLQQKIKNLLEWFIGLKKQFRVNTGVYGRYFKKYLNEKEWNMLLNTYPDGDRVSCAKALIASFDLVHYLGDFIAVALQFTYPYECEKNMLEYCSKHLDIFLE